LLNEMGDEGEALLSPATLDAPERRRPKRAWPRQKPQAIRRWLLTSPACGAMLSRIACGATCRGFR